MELLSFESIATARSLCFKVGPKKREFYIHSSLVSSLSPPLHQLVNGPWYESAKETVEWEKVDEATFVHFCQFAYTGTYRVQSTPDTTDDLETTSESPETEVDANAVATTTLAEVPGKWGGFPTTSRQVFVKDKKKTLGSSSFKRGFLEKEKEPPSSEHMQSVFQQVLADKCPTNSTPSNAPQPAISEVTKKSYSYSDIFLAHARLYVFADCYQINTLAARALNNLQKAFMTNRVQDSDVVDVTQFCVTAEEIPDVLRELMLAYIASKATSVWSNERFRELLQQDSEITFKLLDLIMKAAMVDGSTPPEDLY